MTTYSIMVQHYDVSGRLVVASGFKRKHEAVRRMRQEVEVLATYGHEMYETPEGEIKVLALHEDRAESTFWVRRIAE